MCNSAPISLKHGIEECRKLEEARRRYCVSWDSLSDDVTKNIWFISFLKELRLYDEI